MKVETLIYICNALEVSMRDFFDFTGDTVYHLSNEEKLVIESMRRVDEKERQRLVGYASSINDMRKSDA